MTLYFHHIFLYLYKRNRYSPSEQILYLYLSSRACYPKWLHMPLLPNYIIFSNYSLPITASSSSTVRGKSLSPMKRLPVSVTNTSSSMRMPPKSRYVSSKA